MNDKPIEAEVVHSQALAIREPEEKQQVSLFRTDDPNQIITNATNVASSLKAVVQKQGLISRINGKEYPRCEAWTLLGTMLGVFPVLCWSRKVEGGWEARVEAKTLAGAIVGAAEAQCLNTERNWSNRDDFALRSMAQTRATAKALRMPLGFVMTLAGYQPTPAEEMVADEPEPSQISPVPKQMQVVKPAPPPVKPAAAPAPVTKPVPETPEQRKARFLAQFKGYESYAVELWVELGFLLPGAEGFDDYPISKIPATSKLVYDMVQEVKKRAGVGSPPAEVKPEAPVAQPDYPRCPNCGSPSYVEMRQGDKVYRTCEDCKLQENVSDPKSTVVTAGQALASAEPKDAQEWKSYPIPQWSKYYKEGLRTFGQLNKNQLWWFCINWQPKAYTDKRGKSHQPSVEDYELRGILDKVTAAYGFTAAKE